MHVVYASVCLSGTRGTGMHVVYASVISHPIAHVWVLSAFSDRAIVTANITRKLPSKGSSSTEVVCNLKINNT